jgi:hypothetical protein
MNRIYSTASILGAAFTLIVAVPAGAQAPQSRAYDPSAELSAALPAQIREHVLAVIADARSRGLPAEALERTAFKAMARNVPARDIDRAVTAQAERLTRVQDALARVKNRRSSGEEIEAGAEAVRNGADVTELVALATSAPSGRSLEVPMHVLGSLVARGLPSKDALSAVLARLEARAPDTEIGKLPEQVSARSGGKPDATGRELAGTKRPGTAGAPAGVPAAGIRPVVPPPAPVSRP